MLRHAPLLQVVEFVRLWLTVLAPTPPDPFTLSHLKTFSMIELLPTGQEYILHHVQLPPQCQLVIAGYAQRHSHRKLLHPFALDLLSPIKFTSVSLHSRSLEYEESPNDSRCSLTLRISKFQGPAWEEDMVTDPSESLNMSQVATLHLYDAHAGVSSEPDVIFVLLCISRSIRTLVFHSQAIPAGNFADHWVNPIILMHSAQLDTVVFDNVNFTPVVRSRGHVMSVDSIGWLVAKRRELGWEPPRIVLRDCKVDGETLAKLRDVALVEVV